MIQAANGGGKSAFNSTALAGDGELGRAPRMTTTSQGMGRFSRLWRLLRAATAQFGMAPVTVQLEAPGAPGRPSGRNGRRGSGTQQKYIRAGRVEAKRNLSRP